MSELKKTQLKTEAMKENAEKHSDSVAKKSLDLNKDFESFVMQKWVTLKLAQFHMFPQYCELTRAENREALKEFEETGYKSKIAGSGSVGWSKDRTMKFNYTIPSDLYHWMIQIVDRKFWSNENAGVWRATMRRICRGDQPWKIFLTLKRIYGIDHDSKLRKMQEKYSSKNFVAMSGSATILDSSGNVIGGNDGANKKILRPDEIP